MRWNQGAGSWCCGWPGTNRPTDWPAGHAMPMCRRAGRWKRSATRCPRPTCSWTHCSASGWRARWKMTQPPWWMPSTRPSRRCCRWMPPAAWTPIPGRCAAWRCGRRRQCSSSPGTSACGPAPRSITRVSWRWPGWTYRRSCSTAWNRWRFSCRRGILPAGFRRAAATPTRGIPVTCCASAATTVPAARYCWRRRPRCVRAPAWSGSPPAPGTCRRRWHAARR